MAFEAYEAWALKQMKEQGEQTKASPNPVPGVLTEQIERERLSEAYNKKQAEGITRSAELRGKITKNIQAGADIHSILMDALKCISLMAGDEMFYQQNITKLNVNDHYDIKAKYNELLRREKAAEKYLNDNSIPLQKRESWLPEYQKICNQLSELLMQIGNHSPNEAVNGFEIELNRGV